MKADVVIVAAGSGKRFGSNLPKQFLTVGGMPILAWSIQAFNSHSLIENIILVGSDDWLIYMANEIVERFGFEKVKKIVSGGVKRQDSVLKGVKVLDNEPAVVLIHDAVRPLVSGHLIDQVIRGMTGVDCCIPGMVIADTVKQIDQGLVEKTLDRSQLRLIQTPQAFYKEKLLQILEQAGHKKVFATDEASLIEFFGGQVRCVEGDPQNFKITRQLDLKIVERILEERGHCE